MKTRRIALASLACALLSVPVGAAAQAPPVPELLLRIDDIGMNHSVNLAAEELARTGMPLSASVMFATPWYQEAVEMLRRHPNVTVGIHLTLNSEWRHYRWGPVLGQAAVPTLVDSVGLFHPSTREFLAAKYSLEEVERELTAQVERALRSGLRIAYVDFHMGTAGATPELRAVTERVARKHGLAVSRAFGEEPHSMFSVPVAEKKRELLALLPRLRPGVTHLLVNHVARSNPEMDALVDMNNPDQNAATGEPMVSRHREAELEMLLSPELARLVREGRIRLVTYADLIARHGPRTAPPTP